MHDHTDEQIAISRKLIDGLTVVSVTGEVDVANVRHLRRELVLAIRDDDQRHLVVDLTATTYLDSAGLGALVGARRRLRATGRVLHLVVNRDSLLSLLAITHLDRVFPIHATLADALAARA